MFHIRKTGTDACLVSFLLGQPAWSWPTGPKPMMFKSKAIPEALLPRIAAAEGVPVDHLLIEEVFGAGILEDGQVVS